MIQLQDFLILAKQNVEHILSHPKLHVVIGNESCDLDSMICSIALAYFYHTTRYIDDEIPTKVIPVLNIVSAEFPSRTEHVFLLDRYKIDPQFLVFRDEIDFVKLATNGSLVVSLVDHHVLSDGLSCLSSLVDAIYDHRPIDTQVLWPTSTEIDIKPVGSCATIITQKLLTVFEKTAIEGGVDTVLRLLYETIIYDTIGLKPEAGKVKDLDVQQIAKLEELLHVYPSHSSMFDEIWKAHVNISKLTTYHILVKDLKSVGDVYIPSLPMLVTQFIHRTDVKSALAKFLKDKDASMVILMGLQAESNEIQRDMGIYHPLSTKLYPVMVETLLNSELNLQEKRVMMPHMKYFTQSNVACSRKQVIPIVTDAIDIYNS